MKFFDESHDTPDLPGPLGIGRLDRRRQVGAALRPVRHLGDPAGRHERAQRDQRRGPQAEPRLPLSHARSGSARTIPTDKPMLLTTTNDETQGDAATTASTLDGHARPRRSIMMDKAMGAPTKAKNADVDRLHAVALRRVPRSLGERHRTSRRRRRSRTPTRSRPSSSGARPRTSSTSTPTARCCSAMLIKPDNFDPTKKYPMMVYIYEELSQGLHGYRAPNVGHQHQPHALREQRLRRAAAGHRLRDRLSRARAR